MQVPDEVIRNMLQQLTLPLRWADHATFANFLVGDNLIVTNYLKNLVTTDGAQDSAYLTGREGVGLSHLLSASCQAVNQQGKTAMYLPLAKHGIDPVMLEGIESLDLICLDDIDRVCGQPLWEEALFHCYNRLQMSKTRLIIASHIPPSQLACVMPDLKSRLTASVSFVVQPLSDEQKASALQLRAKTRGFGLSREAATYLLSHYSRDMHALSDILEKLDTASLVAKRRLTVPFIKMALKDAK